MSSITLKKKSSTLGATITQSNGMDSDQFIKAVYSSLAKIINNKELPAKQKHIRVAVMSTHRERGAATYWGVVCSMGLQSHDVTAYKFCLVTHNVLRDGHPNVLVDSVRQIPFLDNLHRLWSNMADGYGLATASYCHLLIVKIKFHEKNPLFPGNLHFESIATFEDEYNTHPDNLFNLCAEILDYLEEVMNLQSRIFKMIERGRWSGSASAQSQCFLSPLVPLIQDACQLYDLIVRSMFKLHSTIPHDILQGHTERFNSMFPIIKTFFAESARLTYVKSFMHLPTLVNPPDFSKVAPSTSKHHYAPIEIIEQPLTEMDDYYYEDDSKNNSANTNNLGTLIEIGNDEAVPPPVLPRGPSQNSTLPPMRVPPKVPPLPPEIDLIPKIKDYEYKLEKMSEMQAEIDYLSNENHQLKETQQNREWEMNEQINEIQERFIQLKAENQKLKKESENDNTLIENLENELKCEKEKMEAKLTACNDKFNKMSQIYSQLREQHIKVLRAKGELQKQLNESNMAMTSQNQLDLQLQQEDFDRTKMELGTLQKQMAEMEEQLCEQNRLINQKNQQLEENQIQLDSSVEKQNKCTCILDAVFDSMKGSVIKSLDVENPSVIIPVTSPDELVSLVQTAIDEWQTLFKIDSNVDTSTFFEQCFVKHVVTLGTNLQLCGVFISSILQFFPITPTVRGNLSHTSRLCGDMFGTLVDVYYRNSTNSYHQFCQSICNELNIQVPGDEPATEAPNRTLVPSCLSNLSQLAQELKEGNRDVIDGSTVDLGQILEEEMRIASRAVDEASIKFQGLLKQNMEENSGVKLQVNSSLIASCTKLMNLIKELMLAVRTMQEDVIKAKGSSMNKKEFYAKNSSWTEGLISGGKSLGLSAKMLMECADAAMNGDGKFVAINACAKGIVSSIAHLVLATKVQQSSSVDAANQITSLSKQVQAATGEVIASSQQAQSLDDEASLMDFGGLNLHQTKQLEMESHIKLMELEASVEKERIKLADLRKHHYKLSELMQQQEN